jgi:biotin carboxyl carrier protein
MHSVAAPTPGFFWRAPSPGAPPFTELGERVERGAALCIIELMKLMNTLSAAVTGTVVEICVRNGERVDAGQILFRIRAEEP